MKCVACGYEHKPDRYEEQEVKYKSGKKKGQVKETQRVLVETYKEFIPVKIARALEFTMPASSKWDPDVEVDVVACPECGTLRLNSWRFHSIYD